MTSDKNIWKRTWGTSTPVYFNKTTYMVISLNDEYFKYDQLISKSSITHGRDSKLEQYEIVLLILKGIIKL